MPSEPLANLMMSSIVIGEPPMRRQWHHFWV
jgi:hypothetical protein